MWRIRLPVAFSSQAGKALLLAMRLAIPVCMSRRGNAAVSRNGAPGLEH